MIDIGTYEVWFVTGSQHLYGEETLRQVASDATMIAEGLDSSREIPIKVKTGPVVTTSEEIKRVCLEANNSTTCVGLIFWMHTFSPAKKWIAGLSALQKPFAHLHTQLGRDIPWADIDMDFMNLHQSAHGGREFGFIGTRLRKNRTVIVGHWQDEDVCKRLGVWSRAACAWADWHTGKLARFGDNMREVAVTEGDKVEAQIRFGYAVDGYGMGELVERVDAVTEQQIDTLVEEYEASYNLAEELSKTGARRQALRDEAKIELGMRSFLEEGGFTAFTTTFEDLYGLPQLPGLAVQHLMADGYGFGAEGDWKTSALLRAAKVMSSGLSGGTSFMEDYTYHLEKGKMMILGAHMLEVCPSISEGKPKAEIHPLSIGGKSDPVRLVFSPPAGSALNATLIDMGGRFRMIINETDVVKQPHDLPKLPVARALWKPKPDLKTAAAAWILGGGAHHSVFTQALTAEYFEDFAEMADLEFLVIDDETTIRQFKNELRWNEVYYAIKGGFGGF
jgi:L-arabinose isomerase